MSYLLSKVAICGAAFCCSHSGRRAGEFLGCVFIHKFNNSSIIVHFQFIDAATGLHWARFVAEVETWTCQGSRPNTEEREGRGLAAYDPRMMVSVG
jgi:hypothetical protein